MIRILSNTPENAFEPGLRLHPSSSALSFTLSEAKVYQSKESNFSCVYSKHLLSGPNEFDYMQDMYLD